MRKKVPSNKGVKLNDPEQSKMSLFPPEQLPLGFSKSDIKPGQQVLPYKSPILTWEQLKKRMEKPPFYQDSKKWRNDNFRGGKEGT